MRTLSNNVLTFLKHTVSELDNLHKSDATAKDVLAEKLEDFKKDTLQKYSELKRNIDSKAEEHPLTINDLKIKLSLLEGELASERPLSLVDIESQRHRLIDILHSVQELLGDK